MDNMGKELCVNRLAALTQSTLQEWHNQLRSSLHPMLLAGIYGATAGVSWIIGFPHNIRTNLLIVAPKACGAVIAALTDYYTWRLAQRLFGNGSRLPGIAVCTHLDLRYQQVFSVEK